MTAIRRILFFGTPQFAVPALDALVAAGRAPVLVVSQPSRPAGRGRKLLEPPVATRARELGLALEQPPRVKAPDFLERVAALAPDLAVVVAFGQIFPRALLELPELGCVNLHASLLPRWRGAAPIAAAIAAGDATTGICLMKMEPELDTGPVYARVATPIGRDETAGELSRRLAQLGAELLIASLPALERGELEPQRQPEPGATYAPKLGGVRELSLAEPAAEVARAFRASTPEPGAALVIGGESVKLLELLASEAATELESGRVIGVAGRALRVATGSGAVEIVRAQRPGGRPVDGRDLANGLRLSPGDRLT